MDDRLQCAAASGDLEALDAALARDVESLRRHSALPAPERGHVETVGYLPESVRRGLDRVN